MCLNKEKLAFLRSEIKFSRKILSKNRVKTRAINRVKIKAIIDIRKPESISEVKSLMGMAQ